MTVRHASFTTDIIACYHTTALSYFVPRLLPSPVRPFARSPVSARRSLGSNARAPILNR